MGWVRVGWCRGAAAGACDPVPPLGRWARYATSAAILASVSIAVAGCASTPHAVPTHSPGTSRPSGSVVQPVPHDAEPSGAGTAPGAAAAVGTAAMRAFCQPRLSAGTWIARLDPFLTLSAASSYATVDPSRVHCTRVTGASSTGTGDDFTLARGGADRCRPVPGDRLAISTSVPWLVSQLVPIEAKR